MSDERRDCIIPGDREKTVLFATEHWIETARFAIKEKGFFAVALSGGGTPSLIYHKLSSKDFKERVDWSKVLLFWSDERAVLPDHPDSNYRMCMESGFKELSFGGVFRMKAEKNIVKEALEYERCIKKKLGNTLFDLVMLGIGEDGHIASLFPETKALLLEDRLVIENFANSKNSWRMTLTLSCINQSKLAVIYALGASKRIIAEQVLRKNPLEEFPASYVGTLEHKALWILDQEAASLLETS